MENIIQEEKVNPLKANIYALINTKECTVIEILVADERDNEINKFIIITPNETLLCSLDEVLGD
jgi:hypothetical protein